MGKRGSRDAEFFLNFTSDHARWMSREQEANDLEARFRAKGREAVGGTGNEKWIGALHISIIAEIWKDVKRPTQRFPGYRHPNLGGGLPALETASISLLTAFQAHGILFVSGADMNLQRITLAAVLAGYAGTYSFAFAQTAAQAPQDQETQKKSETAAAEQSKTASEADKTAAKDSSRADAYYNYAMGHIYEQQYEATSSSEYATKAIDAYKKAYALDPKSPVIGERLAEMYWKAQRIKEAVNEAQEILKRDPNDVQSRRLLGRIYLRSLGDFSVGNGQSETVGKAIEQFREIYRLDPSDTESALWLARLYRLRNDHDKA